MTASKGGKKLAEEPKPDDGLPEAASKLTLEKIAVGPEVKELD